MNRWSYCSSDEDDDEANKDKTKNEEKEQPSNLQAANGIQDPSGPIDGTTTSYNEQHEKGANVLEADNDKSAMVNNEAETKEDDDYEWEYFYEDVEQPAAKKEGETNKTELKSPMPKRLEGLAQDKTNKQIGHVANEGAVKLTPKHKNLEEGPLKEESANPTGKTQRVDPRDGWECPTCTLLNEPKRPGCEACTTERPADYVIPPPGPADTIPRAGIATANEAAASNGAKKTTDAPTLKVVAATVTTGGEKKPIKVKVRLG